MKNKLLYIIALLLTVLICLNIEIRQQTATDRINTLTAENAELQQDIATLQSTADKQACKLTELSEQLRELSKKASRGGDVEREPQPTCLGEYTVTAYCSCEICCGKYAKNRPGGKVYGAAGVELIPGVSVAGWLPLGTHIVIDGHEYIVQDRTAKWVREKYDGKIIDIYFDDHAEAWSWGKQSLEVYKIN